MAREALGPSRPVRECRWLGAKLDVPSWNQSRRRSARRVAVRKSATQLQSGVGVSRFTAPALIWCGVAADPALLAPTRQRRRRPIGAERFLAADIVEAFERARCTRGRARSLLHRHELTCCETALEDLAGRGPTRPAVGLGREDRRWSRSRARRSARRNGRDRNVASSAPWGFEERRPRSAPAPEMRATHRRHSAPPNPWKDEAAPPKSTPDARQPLRVRGSGKWSRRVLPRRPLVWRRRRVDAASSPRSGVSLKTVSAGQRLAAGPGQANGFVRISRIGSSLLVVFRVHASRSPSPSTFSAITMKN